MAELSDLCYCRVIGEGSLVPVIGWVVEAADEELVLATTSDLTTLEHTSQVKVSDKLIYFVKVARDTASLEPPAGWKGDKPKDLAPLETCRTAWTKAKDNELRSSEAEGTEGEGFFSCRFGSAAGPLCRGDSEAEEESDSEGESAFPPKKGPKQVSASRGLGGPSQRQEEEEAQGREGSYQADASQRPCRGEGCQRLASDRPQGDALGQGASAQPCGFL